MHRRSFLGAAAAWAGLAGLARAEEAPDPFLDMAQPYVGPVDVGVLLPLSGPEAARARLLREAMLLAAGEANRRLGRRPLRLHIVDTGGDRRRFADALRRLVTVDKTASVLAPVPAAWRAEATALVERGNGLLWDPAVYEGGECSKHVVHCGATPHQLLKQSIPWLAAEAGPRLAFVAGADQLALELARVARRTAERSGAHPVGVDERPDAVFSTLPPADSVALQQRLKETVVASPFLDETVRPLPGMVAVSTWFTTCSSPESVRFLARMRKRVGKGVAITAAAEAAWATVHLLAEAVMNMGGGDVAPATLREAVKERHIVAPQGAVSIEAANLHARLRPRIAVADHYGRYSIVAESANSLGALPYWGHAAGACTEYGPLTLRAQREG